MSKWKKKESRPISLRYLSSVWRKHARVYTIWRAYTWKISIWRCDDLISLEHKASRVRVSGIRVSKAAVYARNWNADTLSKTFARAIRITPASSLLLEQLHFLLNVYPRRIATEKEGKNQRGREHVNTGKLLLNELLLPALFIQNIHSLLGALLHLTATRSSIGRMKIFLDNTRCFADVFP